SSDLWFSIRSRGRRRSGGGWVGAEGPVDARLSRERRRAGGIRGALSAGDGRAAGRGACAALFLPATAERWSGGLALADGRPWTAAVAATAAMAAALAAAVA